MTAALALCCSASSDAPTSEYRFFFDPRLRSEAGAVSITSAARLLLRGEDELVDPLLWYSLYSVGRRDLVRGERVVPHPAFMIGGVRTWLSFGAL